VAALVHRCRVSLTYFGAGTFGKAGNVPDLPAAVMSHCPVAALTTATQ
jgi:hypothetical protein